MEPVRRNRIPQRQPAVAHRIDGAREHAYWQDHFDIVDYTAPKTTFGDYEPAFRYGWESRAGYPLRTWEEVEEELARGWEKYRGENELSWRLARPAVRDAWRRAGLTAGALA